MKHITIKGSLPLKPRLCSLKGDTEVKKENVRVLKGRVKVGWNVCCIPKKYSLCSLDSFPCGSAGKESACSVGGLGWEDPLEKGKAAHSSILAWRTPWTVHGVAKSWTRLSDFHTFFRIAKHFKPSCTSVPGYPLHPEPPPPSRPPAVYSIFSSALEEFPNPPCVLTPW